MKKIKEITETDDKYSPSDNTWYPSPEKVLEIIDKLNEVVEVVNLLLKNKK